MPLTPSRIAEDAIGLFLECLGNADALDCIDDDEVERARARALIEVSEGTEEETRMLATWGNLLVALKSAYKVMAGENDVEEWEATLKEIEAAMAKAEPTTAPKVSPTPPPEGIAGRAVAM